MKASILGGGNAGFALAFHLSHLGFPVALYEHPDFRQSIDSVYTSGQIIAVAEHDGFKVRSRMHSW